MVDHQDMEGKQDRADEQQQVAFGYRKPIAFHAQQVQACCGHDHSQPDRRAAFLFEEQAQDRHQDDVAGGDKACLPHGAVLHAELLEIRGRAQQDTAADPPQDEVFPSVRISHRSSFSSRVCTSRRLRFSCQVCAF